jgi:hypothetical protein
MDLEKVRKELYEYISKYGLKDIRTIEKSQELDRLIVYKMGGAA